MLEVIGEGQMLFRDPRYSAINRMLRAGPSARGDAACCAGATMVSSNLGQILLKLGNLTLQL